MKQLKFLLIAAVAVATAFDTQAQWSLSGNSISSGDFLGTTNNMAFVAKQNNQQFLKADSTNLAIFGNAENINSQECIAIGIGAGNRSSLRSVAIGGVVIGGDGYPEQGIFGIGNGIGYSGESYDCLSIGNYMAHYSGLSPLARSFHIGNWIESHGGSGRFVIGSGQAFAYLSNPVDNSLVMGFDSDIPTFFVGPSSGVGTTGNVGIATTNPNYKLDVNGTLGVTNDAVFLNRVGIGTPSPSFDLDVNGSIRVMQNSGIYKIRT